MNRLKKEGITVHGVGNLKNITHENISEFIDEVHSSIENSTVTPAELFLKICKTVSKREHKPWVIEKTPHHLNFIDRIKRAFPKVKFVIILREPYGFMLSYKYAQDRLKYLSAEEKRQKKTMYHPLGCALVWKKYARSVRRAIVKFPDNTHLVKLEHIVEDSQTVLRKVLEFLNLSPTDDILYPSVGSSFTKGKKPKLKSEDYFWINFVAESEMTAMGISRKGKADNWLRVIASILQFLFGLYMLCSKWVEKWRVMPSHTYIVGFERKNSDDYLSLDFPFVIKS